MDALEPWSTGTTLVNFAGNGDATARSRAWTPTTLERLRQVKRAVDPSNVFGGGFTTTAAVPAGVR